MRVEEVAEVAQRGVGLRELDEPALRSAEQRTVSAGTESPRYPG